MSPPLRKKEDINYLWEGLSSGDIQTVGTDHCSFNFKGQKTWELMILVRYQMEHLVLNIG